MSRPLLSASLFGGLIALSFLEMGPTLAQIEPDQTLSGPSRSLRQGNQVRIEGGTVANDILFHSFREFSIPESVAVHVDNSPAIATIITRVTGSTPSHLDGQLSANGTANLIFMNPNGIHFGETARLSIGGSFLATTAAEIQFADGSSWGTTSSQDAPLLTLSVPTGLQFGETPGTISNRSVALNRQGAVRGLDTAQLSLLGGAVQLNGGRMRSPQTVELGSFGPRSVVYLDGQGRVADVTATSFGPIEFTQGASLEGGDIRLLGHDLQMSEGAQLVSSGSGTIAIAMDNTVNLDSGSRILSQNGPEVRIEAQQVRISGNSALISQRTTPGQGGAITIEAREGITLTGGGFNQFNQHLMAMASAGLQPNDVITGIFSRAVSGRAGDIRLITDGDLTLQNGSIIDQVVWGEAFGGDLAIEVAGTLDLHESGMLNLSLANSQGSAGDMGIQTGTLSLRDGGVIAGVTFGDGNSGQITVAANDTIDIINTRVDSFIPTGIFSNSVFGTGTAGDIHLVTTHLRGVAGGTISSNTGGFLASVVVTEGGLGGNITIEARESLYLRGLSEDGTFGSGVSTATVGRFPSGDVTINSPRIVIQDGAGFSTETFGPADAGTLRVTANEIQVFGQAPIFGSTSAFSSTSGRQDFRPDATGSGGDIRVWSDRIVVRNEAAFDVRSFGRGAAGVLDVTAAEILLDSGGTFNAETVSGPGGDIRVQSQHLQLDNGSSINTNAGTADGGNISLDIGTLLASGNSDITANALEGRGGQVRITAEGMFGIEFRDSLTEHSDITASSLLGPEFSGEVSINVPTVNLSGALVSLPRPISNPVMLSTCDTGESRFVLTGRRGLLRHPWEATTGEVLWEDWQAFPQEVSEEFSESLSEGTDTAATANLQEAPTPTSAVQLVEAERLAVDESGNPVLVGARSPRLDSSWGQPIRLLPGR
ncbi:MAG: Large exoproteins involved in heme utilization or adhesion [Phormidium sp. OSCR]|nr:MAG: Large exoproteins involved in heme utilization or adhesion [Phormidium sp. OSCR]